MLLHSVSGAFRNDSECSCRAEAKDASERRLILLYVLARDDGNVTDMIGCSYSFSRLLLLPPFAPSLLRKIVFGKTAKEVFHASLRYPTFAGASSNLDS